MTAVLVVLGAIIGAPLRYLTDRLVQSRHDSLFPWSTFSVNLAGCLILGAFTGTGSALPQPVLALVGAKLLRGVAPAEPQTEVWTKSELEYPTLGEQRHGRAKRSAPDELPTGR